MYTTTGVCGEQTTTPFPRQTTLGVSFCITTSGAGVQFLPQDCRAQARTKGRAFLPGRRQLATRGLCRHRDTVLLLFSDALSLPIADVRACKADCVVCSFSVAVFACSLVYVLLPPPGDSSFRVLETWVPGKCFVKRGIGMQGLYEHRTSRIGNQEQPDQARTRGKHTRHLAPTDTGLL